MTRQHGLRRLGAFSAPTLLIAFVAGFSLTAVDPATPESLAPLTMPAPAAVASSAADEAPAVDPPVSPPAVVADERAVAPEPAPEPEPCADALADVASAGLPLPAGVDYLCPSTRFAHQGAACWDEWPCPGGAFIAINMDLGAGATPAYLRHVVAHEICHILDFRDRGWTTEPRADACAAGYGF